jgi:hypothetical protein
MNTKLSINHEPISLNQMLQGTKINPFWVLGFVEGEGTFGFKGLTPYFQIAQQVNSNETLKMIEQFFIKFSNEPINFPTNPLNLSIKFSKSLNKSTNVISYVIGDIDVLYTYFLPFFYNAPFYSRKKVDFLLWTIGLLLHKYGHFYDLKGRQLLVKITNIINYRRYSTNTLQNTSTICIHKAGGTDSISFEEVNSVLSMPKSEWVESYTHTQLAQHLSQKKSTYLGKKVYVYDNGIMLVDSPFISYNCAQRFLEFRSKQVITRYIDTNKVYKFQDQLGTHYYTFYSCPRVLKNIEEFDIKE